MTSWFTLYQYCHKNPTNRLMCSIDPGKNMKKLHSLSEGMPGMAMGDGVNKLWRMDRKAFPHRVKGNPIGSYHKCSLGIEIWRQSSQIAISNTNLQAILRLCLKYSSDWWGGGGGGAHIVTLKAYTATQWLHNSEPVSCSLASWVQVRVARLPIEVEMKRSV